MTLAPKEDDAVAATTTGRDALGQTCFLVHFVVMLYIVFGWAAPWKPALVFYAVFLPAVATQWLLNKNSCVLNNLESLIRTGRWRDEGNEEEGAWLLTLARDTLGVRATRAQMDIIIHVVLALLWGLGLCHLLGRLWWRTGA
jgi:hypothetical protein